MRTRNTLETAVNKALAISPHIHLNYIVSASCPTIQNGFKNKILLTIGEGHYWTYGNHWGPIRIQTPTRNPAFYMRRSYQDIAFDAHARGCV